MKLNGWQRLWVVLAALYLAPVVVLAIVFWPSPATTYHRDEFTERMPADVRANVAGAYESKWKWEEAWKARVVPPVESGRQRLQREVDGVPPRGVFGPLISEPVTFPNGAVLDVRVAKEGDTEADVRVGPAYWNVVEAEARHAKWTLVSWMALLWLIPCVVLYILGWAVAWVRRGFKPLTRTMSE